MLYFREVQTMYILGSFNVFHYTWAYIYVIFLQRNDKFYVNQSQKQKKRPDIHREMIMTGRLHVTQITELEQTASKKLPRRY